jgi:hypothetical protein
MVGKIDVRVRAQPQPRLRMPKFLKSLILVVAASGAALAFGVGTAHASKCSAALIHDWYVDGRIDQTYAVHCYQEALQDIPEDQIVYGTLRDDLTRALQSVIRNHNGPIDPNVLVPGSSGPGGGQGTGGMGFFHWLAHAIGPNTADSIPVPLLVLGGLALALILAAAVSYFARRWQARRAATDPPPTGPTF